MSAALTAPVGSLTIGTAAQRFVVWLLLATVVPMVVLGTLGSAAVDDRQARSAFALLFLISVAHGGLSGLFWLDGRYRAHIASQLWRYYANAALLMAGALTGAIVLGRGFCALFAVVYVLWTIFHFSRQNWGVLCLTAAGLGSPRPGRLENVACHTAAVGGAIGVLPPFVNLARFDGVLTVGLGLVLCGFALSLVVAVRLAAENAHPLRVAMTVATGAFFLPVYICGPVAGFVVIGGVHAAQYGIIMTALAADRKQGSRVSRIGGMLMFAVIYLGLFVALSNPRFWHAWRQQAEVLLYAVVMWHFMIDAGLWRLSQPFQRKAVRESLPFLFGRA